MAGERYFGAAAEQIASRRLGRASWGAGYVVSEGGNGVPQVTSWDEALLGPRPTAAELEAEALPAAKAQRRVQLILAADRDYKAVFVRDGQYVELEKDYLILRSLLGLALTPAQTNQRAQMRAVIEKLQQRLAAVTAAATEAEVEAVAW